jgi:hypothetical protein
LTDLLKLRPTSDRGNFDLLVQLIRQLALLVALREKFQGKARAFQPKASPSSTTEPVNSTVNSELNTTDVCTVDKQLGRNYHNTAA